MSQITGCSISSTSDHLKKIGKVRKLDKWVPNEPSESLSFWHFEVCSMLHLRNSYDLFLGLIISFKQKWIFYNHRLIMMNSPNIFQNQNFQTDYDGFIVFCDFFYPFCNLTRKSLHMFFLPITRWNAYSDKENPTGYV